MNKKNESKSNGSIEVAQIGYRQATMVAIISAISTFLVTATGGYFTFISNANSSTKEINANQRYIQINEVIGASDHFRMQIEINGSSYSYPTKTLWADPEALSLPVSFPVVNADEYRVYFWGWQKSNDDPSAFHPQPVDVIKFEGEVEKRTSAISYPFSVKYEIIEQD